MPLTLSRIETLDLDARKAADTLAEFCYGVKRHMGNVGHTTAYACPWCGTPGNLVYGEVGQFFVSVSRCEACGGELFAEVD